MSRLPPQPEFRPIRLNQALKPVTVVEAEETASEVVPIAGSVAVRIRLKADKAGELDVAILDATGATPVEGEPKGVLGVAVAADTEDRKSTRLNSSHVKISYAVFCLKK